MTRKQLIARVREVIRHALLTDEGPEETIEKVLCLAGSTAAKIVFFRVVVAPEHFARWLSPRRSQLPLAEYVVDAAIEDLTECVTETAHWAMREGVGAEEALAGLDLPAGLREIAAEVFDAEIARVAGAEAAEEAAVRAVEMAVLEACSHGEVTWEELERIGSDLEGMSEDEDFEEEDHG